MIEQVAGVDELVSRTRPLRTEIQTRLLRVVLEEAERRDTARVPVGCRLLAARPEHGQRKNRKKRGDSSPFHPWHPFWVHI
jgi:hypothetical protein